MKGRQDGQAGRAGTRRHRSGWLGRKQSTGCRCQDSLQAGRQAITPQLPTHVSPCVHAERGHAVGGVVKHGEGGVPLDLVAAQHHTHPSLHQILQRRHVAQVLQPGRRPGRQKRVGESNKWSEGRRDGRTGREVSSQRWDNSNRRSIDGYDCSLLPGSSFQSATHPPALATLAVTTHHSPHSQTCVSLKVM